MGFICGRAFRKDTSVKFSQTTVKRSADPFQHTRSRAGTRVRGDKAQTSLWPDVVLFYLGLVWSHQ